MPNLPLWMTTTSPAEPHEPPFPKSSLYDPEPKYRPKDTSIYTEAAISQTPGNSRRRNPFDDQYAEKSENSPRSSSSRFSTQAPTRIFMADARFPFIETGRKQGRRHQKVDNPRRLGRPSNAYIDARKRRTRVRGSKVSRRMILDEGVVRDGRRSSSQFIDIQQERTERARQVTFDENVIRDTDRPREVEKTAAMFTAQAGIESKDVEHVEMKGKGERKGRGRKLMSGIVELCRRG